MKLNDISRYDRYYVEGGRLKNYCGEDINPSETCGEDFIKASYLLKIVNTFELVMKK